MPNNKSHKFPTTSRSHDYNFLETSIFSTQKKFINTEKPEPSITNLAQIISAPSTHITRRSRLSQGRVDQKDGRWQASLDMILDTNQLCIMLGNASARSCQLRNKILNIRVRAIKPLLNTHRIAAVQKANCRNYSKDGKQVQINYG